jgi:hypothetical protein
LLPLNGEAKSGRRDLNPRPERDVPKLLSGLVYPALKEFKGGHQLSKIQLIRGDLLPFHSPSKMKISLNISNKLQYNN